MQPFPPSGGIHDRGGRRRHHRCARLYHGRGLREEHFGSAMGVLVDRLDPQA